MSSPYPYGSSSFSSGGERGLHGGETRARQELTLVPESPQPGGQILGGAAQAAVGFGGLDPRRGRKAVIALPGAVVVERHMPSRQPAPGFVDRDRTGRPHPEPVEQAPLKQLGVRPSGHRLQDDSHRPIADVGVVTVLAGRESRLGVGEHDHVVGRRRREVGGGDHSGRVGEQMVQRDRSEAAAHRQPRDVVGDRRMQVEHPFLDELQRDHRGEGLADRRKRPERIGRRRPIGTGKQGPLGVGDGDRGGRRHTRRQHPSGQVVEGTRIEVHHPGTLPRSGQL